MKLFGFVLPFGRTPKTEPAPVRAPDAIVRGHLHRAQYALVHKQKDIHTDLEGFWAGIEAVYAELRPLLADYPDILAMMRVGDTDDGKVTDLFDNRWAIAQREAKEALATAMRAHKRREVWNAGMMVLMAEMSMELRFGDIGRANSIFMKLRRELMEPIAA